MGKSLRSKRKQGNKRRLRSKFAKKELAMLIKTVTSGEGHAKTRGEVLLEKIQGNGVKMI